eukprot:gb/GECG01015866.1/.p1 GENE.gb/GECG01015866.1/~~gb/GECG01015866.1/.p1  ORF type:complete len:228 (+),score=34.82 gb/GECG01015866.1/:1-684(+)
MAYVFGQRAPSRTLSIAVLLAVVFGFVIRGTEGIHFYITEGQQRCFLEDTAEETLIVARYENPDVKEWGEPGFTETGIRVVVTSPLGKLEMSRTLTKEGRFAFTTHEAGEHSICLGTNNTRWFGEPRQFKFELQLDVGSTAINYEDVAKKEHLSTLALEVRKLNDKVQDIIKSQSYQQEREIQFRDTSESTNSRVQWWSIVQTAVCVASGVWQTIHLKNYFRKKKLQ